MSRRHEHGPCRRPRGARLATVEAEHHRARPLRSARGLVRPSPRGSILPLILDVASTTKQSVRVVFGLHDAWATRVSMARVGFGLDDAWATRVWMVRAGFGLDALLTVTQSGVLVH